MTDLKYDIEPVGVLREEIEQTAAQWGLAAAVRRMKVFFPLLSMMSSLPGNG